MITSYRVIALFIVSIFIHWHGFAQTHCTFDAEVKRIYSEIVNLDLDLARNELGQKDSKLNKAYILLENEIDFYQLFVYDQKTDFQNLKSNKNKRIDEIDDSDLPLEWKRFLKAEILLQWTLIYLKQDEELKAFQSIRESVQLLEENVDQYPAFMYSYKSLGILHSLLSTIPESLQWAARLLGLSGNLQAGKNELQKFIQFAESGQDLFTNEANAAMSFIYCYLDNKPEQAYSYWIQKMGIQDPNALQVFVQCKIANKAGYNDAAINALQSLDQTQRDKLPYLYFLMGLTGLQKLELKSDSYFLKFLQLYQGSSYIKEAYQKLAWIALLKGEEGLYHLYISNCLTKGNALTDEDRQAQQEALSNKIPDVTLLKARLLFDGGYADRAYEILSSQKDYYYANAGKKLECAYRLGRISQLKKQFVNALQYYNDALFFDPQMSSYMTCNALLQCGIIYESQNKKQESAGYYQQVLKTNPDQYKRSIHQKAKAGLARLKG
jgi:hypothetical protein